MKFSVEPTVVTHAVSFGCVVVDLENPLSTDPVTLSLGTDPTMGSVLSGVLTVNAVKGVAVFSGLQISLAGNGYTLVATAPQQRNVFQPGFYYNCPPSGDPDFPETTLVNNNPHGNFTCPNAEDSVTSDPFNVI